MTRISVRHVRSAATRGLVTGTVVGLVAGLLAAAAVTATASATPASAPPTSHPGGKTVQPTLVARASLSADFIAPGPPSGALASPGNGRTGPFPGQVSPASRP